MPLKPIRKTVNIPAELEALIEKRIREEKYPSFSAYLTGLLIFDLWCRRPHSLTGSFMREPQWLRDQVIAELVANFDDPSKPPGWFERRVEDLIEERRLREARKD